MTYSEVLRQQGITDQNFRLRLRLFTTILEDGSIVHILDRSEEICQNCEDRSRRTQEA
jgi:hypothetical protein